MSEAEVRAGDDDLGADRPQVLLRELLRREPHQLRPEGGDERRLDPRLLEQLQAPLERRQELYAIAQHGARVRVEGHDGRAKMRRLRSLDHTAVPTVHAVERPDRDRASCGLELVRTMRHVHALTPMRSSTTASGSSRDGSNASGVTASATVNGPTSVRRSVRQ